MIAKLKKLLSLALVSALIISTSSVAMPSVAMAKDNSEKKNKPINISITVQERNGVSVQNYFFRRGIALEKGQIFTTDNICLKDGDKILTSTTESLQKYDDGSICWLLVSGVVDLKPNEFKQLYVTDGRSNAKTITYEQDPTYMNVHSTLVDLKFGPMGIESFKYKGVEKLNDIPIRLYVTEGGKTDYLTVTEISMIKSTDSYSKFKLKGRLRKDILGEMYVTMVEGSSRVQIDHRITVQDNYMVESTGLTLGFVDKVHEKGTIVDEDYLTVNDIQLSTYDNTRFNGATNVGSETGYIIKEKEIDFAPIVNGKPYLYYDGFSRTAHLYISFYNDAKSYATTLALPPVVKVDNEQYVRAGQILTTQLSALNRKCMESFKFGYSKSIGIFNAGILPYEINSELGMVGRFGTMPGEIEYNFGVCWMQTGDEEMYRHMFDLSEVRADLCCYRGGRADIYGCLRGATTTDTYRFNMNHSYYGDQGGLYMTYVLSGDEYVLETLKLTAYKTLNDMYMRESLDGSRSILYRTWSLDTSSPPSNTPEYCESRGLIRIRTFYLCAQLFEDDRFMQACNDFLHWAEAAQRPDGSYPHFMYHDGGKYFDKDTDEEIVKDYVMLYGLRGVSQLLDFTDNETALKITLKVADYLCSQRENFGPILWYPNSNKEVYNLNDGGGRGPSPMTTSLAIDVLCTAFEKTGSDRYLKTIADFLEAFLGMEMGGLGAEDYGCKDIAPRGDRLKVGESPRGSSLLRCSDDLSKIFTENKDKLLEMGYENVLLIFEDGAKPAKKGNLLKYVFPDVIHNVYQCGDEKAVFLQNLCAEGNDPNGDWEKTVQLVFDENCLWQGVPNIIDSTKSVMLEKYLEQAQGYSAIQRPIMVEQLSGKLTANVMDYNKDRIEVSFKGDYDIGLKIKDGKFKIDDSQGYDVKVLYDSPKDIVKLVVTRGGNIHPKNGTLSVQFNDKGNNVAVVGVEKLEKVGFSMQNINTALTSSELSSFMTNAFEKNITFNEELPKWKDFAPIVLTAMAEKDQKILSDLGLSIAFDISNSNDISDESAVKLACEALSVQYEGDRLKSDVYLPKESLYNTKVVWKSENSDILSEDGVLNRDKINCDSIKLMATISKNSASEVKEFVIPLEPTTIPTANQGPGFAEETMLPLVPHKTEVEITYTATPFLNSIDSTMSFTSSKVGTRTNADLPYIIRFNPDGIIDMYDSSTYKKTNIHYEANKKYYFRIVIRPDKLTYDAYVTPDGGEELVIGQNCGPRQSAPVVDMIDQMWTWASVDKVYKVQDVNIVLKDNIKSESLGNGFYDENGLVFGKYKVNPKSTFALLSNNGKIMNWTNIGAYHPELGGNVQMYVGKETGNDRQNDLIQILQTAGLLNNDTENNSYVTPASLSKIIAAMDIK